MSFKCALFSFQGRLGRIAYLGYGIVAYLLGLALILVPLFVTGYGNFGSVLAIPLFLAGIVVLFWSSAAIMVKRLHDLNMPGSYVVWIYAVSFLSNVLEHVSPVLMILTAIVALGMFGYLLFAPGTTGPNQFGEVPA